MSSLRKLAADLGVSHSTVSAALRGLPGVKPSTRERVRSFAERSGYRLNPLASALMGDMRRAKGGVFRGVLALLRLESEAVVAAETRRAQGAVVDGARSRAVELGFKTEEVTLGRRGYAPENLLEIFRNRGVDGVVVLAPEDDERLRRVEWSRLNAVCVGPVASEHGLSSVGVDQTDAMAQALRRLGAAGFQRPGLVLRASCSREARVRWEAAYRATYSSAGMDAGREPPRPFLVAFDYGEDFRAWVESEQIDVVLSGSDKRSRYPIPFYGLDLPAGAAGVAGIDQGQARLGVKAVDLLAEQLMRNRTAQTGTSVTLLPARWRMAEAEKRVA